MSRRVVQKVLSVEQSEGVGARVRRSIGRPELRNLDPFLLLDEFKVKAPAGFPDHPHRGFETVTYMLKGSFQHEDFCGHAGTINEGDLQWMTAGRGIVHSEMPGSGDEDNVGLQLWVNLRASEKLKLGSYKKLEPTAFYSKLMVPASYQELLSKDIPKVDKDGVHATVIAGECLGMKSAVRTRTPTSYLDLKLSPGATFKQPVETGWNAFVYILNGTGSFGPAEAVEESSAHHTLVFGPGEFVECKNTGKDLFHFVLIAGQPLKEPVVQHGPFVMNTHDEIMVANRDYSLGINGFERAVGWQSKIGLR